MINSPPKTPREGKKRAKTPMQSGQEKSARSFIKRHSIAVGVAALSAIAGGYSFLPLSKDEKTTESIPAPKSEKKQFNFNEYSVDPRFGEALKMYSRPENNKTIIYIMDYHANGSAAARDGLSSTVTLAQKEIFLMLDHAALTYEKFGLVHESWARYDGLTPEQNLNKNLAQNFLLDEAQIPDDEERYRLLAPRVGQTLAGATAYINAIHRNVVPLFPMDEREEIESFIVDAKRETPAELVDNGSLPCEDLGIDLPSDISLREASRRLDSGKGNDKMNDCYCALDAAIIRNADEWGEYRSKVASQREMKAAFAYDGNLVFVVAGGLHTKEAVRLMEERKDINHILITPRGMPEDFLNYNNTDVIGKGDRKRFEKFCAKANYKKPKLDAIIQTIVNRKVEAVQKALK